MGKRLLSPQLLLRVRFKGSGGILVIFVESPITMKNYLFLSLILLSNSLTYGQQNVGIGTDNPNPNAVLDLESDDKGFLMPRLNTNARNTLGTLCGPNEEN